MPTDTNQTIQDSRKAAISFLEAAKKKEERRNNRTPGFSGDTNTAVESRPRLEYPDDFTDTAIEESIRKGAKNRRAAKRAVDDFWRAAMRKGANNGISVAPKDEESGYDLHDRFSHMSDEEFDRGVANGTITPEQIRKAGQEAYENYMLDVWSETDQADEMGMKWPSYEEFMENPEKYGYTNINDDSEYPDRFDRYKPSRYQKK